MGEIYIYISIYLWLKVAFYCKICWREPRSSKLASHLLSDASPQCPEAGPPEDDFACGKPRSPSPMLRVSKQTERGGREKERPSFTTMAPMHPFTGTHPDTLAGRFPLTLLWKPVRTDAPQLCAAGEGRRSWSHIQGHPGCAGAPGPRFWPPSTCRLNRHAQTMPTHQSPATHLFDSNDKVRTQT